MMMDTTDLNIIGIDRDAWRFLWRGITDCEYDPVPFLSLSEEILRGCVHPLVWQGLWDTAKKDGDVVHFLDSMSPNQIESKRWLADCLALILEERTDLKIQINGGWFGYPLINLLKANLDIQMVQNIDIDENAIQMYRRFASDEKFKVVETIGDVKDPTPYDRDVDVVINTSSEHMLPLPVYAENKNYRYVKNTPKHKDPCLFAVQSNDMFHIADHHYCCKNVDELVRQTGLTEVLYKGTIEMSNGYNRFMVIGYV